MQNSANVNNSRVWRKHKVQQIIIKFNFIILNEIWLLGAEQFRFAFRSDVAQ